MDAIREIDVDDPRVVAAGRVSEALEWVERARGRLYDLHQMVGHADFLLDEAAEALEKAGCTEEAERLRHELIGRNVLEGRWTFQLVEEFDDGYYAEFRTKERELRELLVGGERHALEAGLKNRRRTHGRRGHEWSPEPAGQAR